MENMSQFLTWRNGKGGILKIGLENWVTGAKQKSCAVNEQKTFWRFDLPDSDSGAAQKISLMNMSALRQPLKGVFCCYWDKLWNERCNYLCVAFCVCVCIGHEGSVVQPFCCGSGREEEQTGWWRCKHETKHTHCVHITYIYPHYWVKCNLRYRVWIVKLQISVLLHLHHLFSPVVHRTR